MRRFLRSTGALVFIACLLLMMILPARMDAMKAPAPAPTHAPAQTAAPRPAAAETTQAASTETPAPESATTVPQPTPTPANAQPITKQETIYVDIAPGGTTKDAVVSVWLQNPGKLAEIRDLSNLRDARTLRGETGKLDASGMFVWKADGSDVYYQGHSEEPLPVSLDIRCTLDGAPIAAADLAGKSGRVTIEYAFANQCPVTELIDGKPVTLVTPFTCVTMITLPGDIFANVESQGARLMREGSDTVVTGLCFPGLNDALGLSEEDAKEITDGFIITAQVTDFQLDTATTLMMPGVVDDVDFGRGEDIARIKEDLDTMDEASATLAEGGDALYDGMASYAKAVKQYVSGVRTLSKGASGISGAIAQTATGAQQLADEVAAMNEQLGGALDKLPTEKLNAIIDRAEELKVCIEDTAKKLQALLDSADSLASFDTVFALLRNVNALQAVIEENGRVLAESKDMQDTALYKQLQKNSKTIKDFLTRLKQALGDISAEELQQLLKQAEDLLSQMTDIDGLMRETIGMDFASIKTLLDGMDSLRDGLDLLSGACAELADGLGQISEGADGLADGAKQIADGGSALVKGTNSLRSAVGMLSDGLHEFDEQAIDRLTVDAVNKLNDFELRKAAINRLGGEYQSFTGLPAGAKGSVRFLLSTQRVGVPQVAATLPPESDFAPPPEEPSFLDRFGDWLKESFGGN